MTREEFIAKHIDELAGIMLDAAVSHRTGGELSMWVRAVYPKLKTKLGDMWWALYGDEKQKPTNGNGHAKPPLIPGVKPTRAVSD